MQLYFDHSKIEQPILCKRYIGQIRNKAAYFHCFWKIKTKQEISAGSGARAASGYLLLLYSLQPQIFNRNQKLFLYCIIKVETGAREV